VTVGLAAEAAKWTDERWARRTTTGPFSIAFRSTILTHSDAGGSSAFKGQLYLVKDGPAPLWSRVVHIVVGDIVAPYAISRHRAQKSFDDASRRVAQEKGG